MRSLVRGYAASHKRQAGLESTSRATRLRFEVDAHGRCQQTRPLPVSDALCIRSGFVRPSAFVLVEPRSIFGLLNVLAHECGELRCIRSLTSKVLGWRLSRIVDEGRLQIFVTNRGTIHDVRMLLCCLVDCPIAFL